MKSISKKVMAGLLVGATSLSIWAPASQAAPANNAYHSIHLAADATLKWDVYGNSPNDEAGILLYNGNFSDNEQFLFFPLDGGLYAIVNKNSGKAVTIGAGFITPTDYSYNREGLKQSKWTGAAADKWYLRDKGNNNYEIVNQGYGKVASYARLGISGQKYVDLDDSNPSDNDRLFHIPAAARSTFSLPTLPTIGTRPDAPDYREDFPGRITQQLPQTSNSVVVGASLIPCIMVNDNQASDYTKIHNSPYYTLVKEEYWDKTFSTVLPAGYTKNYSFKTGMTSVDQQRMTDTLSMKIGADFGLKFGDASASLKTEISRTIQTEITSTSTEASEETITHNVTSEAGKTTAFTEYQLATKYTLKRADGSIVSDPWVVKNNKNTIVRKIEK
ncbi:toxin [Bacillus pseudomycoides]|uniref:RICIN domain-containing protein n=1 Tax=Bacillus pseudomycoides TaxID=64104 RepID=UPI0009AB0562|nr:RICIN domain-containing protein [Bacillus pseudomycoides]PHE31427.1 toxin [Bacillus pseudomycoides]